MTDHGESSAALPRSNFLRLHKDTARLPQNLRGMIERDITVCVFGRYFVSKVSRSAGTAPPLPLQERWNDSFNGLPILIQQIGWAQ